MLLVIPRDFRNIFPLSFMGNYLKEEAELKAIRNQKLPDAVAQLKRQESLKKAAELGRVALPQYAYR